MPNEIKFLAARHIIEQLNDKKFGLCDDNNDQPAYIDRENPKKWVAEINNNKQTPIDFIPIDNNIEILRDNGEQNDRCDVLLHYDKGVVFIELKDQKAHWIPDAIRELKASIEMFSANYNIGDFALKHAYAANKVFPQFKYSKKNIMQGFRQETKFKLFITAKVKI